MAQSIEQCHGRLRLLQVPYTTTKEPRLQQLWQITDYEGGAPVARREEWRDVPLVIEPATPPAIRFIGQIPPSVVRPITGKSAQSKVQEID